MGPGRGGGRLASGTANVGATPRQADIVVSMSVPDPTLDAEPRVGGQPWLTPGVRGIGLASLRSDPGHEIPTALLPSFLVTVLGAPAAAFGLIEGIADALSEVAKVVGWRARRRPSAASGRRRRLHPDRSAARRAARSWPMRLNQRRRSRLRLRAGDGCRSGPWCPVGHGPEVPREGPCGSVEPRAGARHSG